MAKDTIDIIMIILRRLEIAMDEESPDFEDISANNLEVSEMKFSRILEMMQESGLIDGIHFSRTLSNPIPEPVFIEPRITLTGIQYLADNSTVAKVVKAAKLFKDIIPGI